MKANPLYKGVWQAPLIDNPAYKGVWKPRLIPNPNYFEDPSPANLHPIGGVGFEIWSMTEDILFDNIYIGQSPDEAKALAKQTFHVKHPIEKKQKDAEIEAEKAAADEPQPLTGVAAFVNNLQEAFVGLKENPTGFVREQVLLFVDMAKEDGPVVAFQRKPEIGAAIALVLLSFFGAIGALFGIVGSAGKPVVKSSKKTDAPSPDDKTGDKAKKDAKLISSEPAPEKDTPVKRRK
ncbi:hypothetical protein FRC03_010183 [Tulasnella sp. 419]|nr:hypothetical protein FRC03_010183 [Tulasnella sp. 419]